MKKRVRWTAHAHRRLLEIGLYVEAHNPAAAARVIGAITMRVDRLSREPGGGRPGRIRGTRELVVVGTPYIVAYLVHANEIEVLTVQHGRQRWPDDL